MAEDLEQDEKWMARALELAKKGVGLTSPNPSVGAVIVREGQEVAAGWHQANGLPHAEREAINAAKAQNIDMSGATIYVTLEPCSTHGRTGACTDALIAAGFSRVVYASSDPNPAHSGVADEILENAGIEVSSGILKMSSLKLIHGFSSVQNRGRPWVILKCGMSLDGRLTRPSEESQWLTSPSSRELVQSLRAEVDAIISSGETVRRDDPLFSLRSLSISKSKKQPLRVIITNSPKIDFVNYRILNDEYADRNLFFPFDDPKDILIQLARNYDCQTVLLEAGGRLNGLFMDAGLVDEAMLFYAPMVCGGSVPATGGEGVTVISHAWGLENPEINSVGDDLCVRGALVLRADVANRIDRKFTA